MFFEFYKDNTALNYTDSQFMFGDSLLIIPFLEKNNFVQDIYISNENWNYLENGRNFHNTNTLLKSHSPHKGIIKEVYFGLRKQIKVFLRGGKIILWQNSKLAGVRNTAMLQYTYSKLKINLDHNGNAEGDIIFDDGISLNTIQNKDYIHVNIRISSYKDELKFNIVNDVDEYSYKFYDIRINEIIIFRASELNRNLYQINFYLKTGKVIRNVKFNFDTVYKNSLVILYNKAIDIRKIDYVKFVKVNQCKSVVFKEEFYQNITTSATSS